jgi:hypothetical protein
MPGMTNNKKKVIRPKKKKKKKSIAAIEIVFFLFFVFVSVTGQCLSFRANVIRRINGSAFVESEKFTFCVHSFCFNERKSLS